MNPGRKSQRTMTADEKALIRSLLPDGHEHWEDAHVIDMLDGGMGSIRFARPDQRSRAAAIAEAQYVDEDGVVVSIELSVDNRNELFELDLWKVDFSRLRRYPKPEDVNR